jgi:hypothetical protein
LLDDKFFVQGYGGWGLARGVALPVTSSALNPLDDLQPRERQVLWGAGLGWSQQGVDARLIYQRQISSESDNIVGEFAAFDATIRPSASFAIVGGVDYDVATGNWGTADLAATITAPRGGLAVTVGGKRYRPYFPLWTIWGAFSPVGYSAGYGSVSYAPISGLELWTRGEAYGYEDTEAESSNVSVESDGWRWTLGGAYKWTAGWTFKADYFIDKGPGSRSLGFDFVTTWQPMGSFYVTADVQRLQRPLEFRFDNIDVWSYGLRLEYRTVRGVRLNGEVRQLESVPTQPGCDGELRYSNRRGPAPRNTPCSGSQGDEMKAMMTLSMPAVAAVLGLTLTPGEPTSLAVEFSHAKHLALMDCTMCHSGVADGNMYPDPTFCGACHNGSVQPEVDWSPPVPSPQMNLRFSHGTHMSAAGNECADCHVDAGSGDNVVNLAIVEQCRECHSNSPVLKTTSVWHGGGWVARHQLEAAASPESCANCHVRADCLECHRPNAATGSPAYHPVNFLSEHPSWAYNRSVTCGRPDLD